MEIFTFTMQYPDFLFPGKTQYSDLPKPEDLRITRTMNSIGPLSWIKTARAIKKAGIQMLIIKFWIPLMAPCLGSIARLCRRNGIEVVSILDNVIPHEPHFWDKWLIRYYIGSVDRFVAMSASVQEDCRRFLPEEKKGLVALSPHPLYDNFGEPVEKSEARRVLGLPQDKTLLLFFGFIRDYKGLDLLMHSISRIKRQINPELRIDGILMTMVDSRTINARDITSALRESVGLNVKVFNTEIPRSVRAQECANLGKSIFEHDPGGKVADAYERLSKEVTSLERETKTRPRPYGVR